MAKKIKPARGEAFGILNPFGDLWTYAHFPTEEAARACVATFWKGISHPPDLSLFKVIPVKVTVSAATQPTGQAGEEEL